jgi:hypothetical protein
MSNISTGGATPGSQLPISTAQAVRPARAARPLLIDRYMDTWDFEMSRHRAVDATPDQTYAALRAIDFAKIRSPILRAMLAMGRQLQRRAVRRGEAASPLPDSFTFDNLEAYGRIRLAEEPGSEIVVGALTRPFQAHVTSMKIDPATFAAFDSPGYVKVAASFSVQPYGEKRTLLSYEVRLRGTDEAAKKKLSAAWPFVSPVVRSAMDAVLSHVAAAAAARRAD